MVGSDHEWSWHKGFRPMIDIIERLHRFAGGWGAAGDTCAEAADEIERLREDLAAARLSDAEDRIDDLQAEVSQLLDANGDLKDEVFLLRDALNRISRAINGDLAREIAVAALMSITELQKRRELEANE